jgi:FAD/FMN-containing dehydrogenase
VFGTLGDSAKYRSNARGNARAPSSQRRNLVSSEGLESWGRYPRVDQSSRALWWRSSELPDALDGTLLPRGQGRSYGDSCLNPSGTLILTRPLDRFVAFDAERGIVECEAGVTLLEIHALVMRHGWFLPVVPGTQLVTVGGAIANDVHGKNHHRAGTFGSHVNGFELMRSDGTRRWCSPTDNADLFRATVGGLGLTGVITHASISLRRIRSAAVECQTLPFATLAEFRELCVVSDPEWEYTVAWFDFFSYDGERLHGLFSRGRHLETHKGPLDRAPRRQRLGVPAVAPKWLLDPRALRLFNRLYYAAGKMRAGMRLANVERFLFPLDELPRWNRLYGPDGFRQLQCVFPDDVAMTAIGELLALLAHTGCGSFLAVMKRFGTAVSPGLLSFPIRGITLALDIPNRPGTTSALFDRCHEIVGAHGGRVYPAKDACMPAEIFARGYPRWREFAEFVDPRFSSGFWERTGARLLRA